MINTTQINMLKRILKLVILPSSSSFKFLVVDKSFILPITHLNKDCFNIETVYVNEDGMKHSYWLEDLHLINKVVGWGNSPFEAWNMVLKES